MVKDAKEINERSVNAQSVSCPERPEKHHVAGAMQALSVVLNVSVDDLIDNDIKNSAATSRRDDPKHLNDPSSLSPGQLTEGPKMPRASLDFGVGVNKNSINSNQNSVINETELKDTILNINGKKIRSDFEPTSAPSQGDSLNSTASSDFSLELALEQIELNQSRALRFRSILLSLVSIAWLIILLFVGYKLDLGLSLHGLTIERATVASFAFILPVLLFLKCLDFVFMSRLANPRGARELGGVDGSALRLVLAAMRREILASSDSLQQISTQASDLETRITTEIRAIEKATSENQSKMLNIVSDFKEQGDLFKKHFVYLKKESDNMTREFEQISVAALGSLRAANKEALDLLVSSSESLGDSLRSAKNQIESNINEIRKDAIEEISRSFDLVTEQLSARSAEIGERFVTWGSQHAEVLDKTTSLSQERLSSAAVTAQKSIEESGNSLVGELQALSIEAMKNTNEIGSSIERSIQENINLLASSVTSMLNDSTEINDNNAIRIANLLEKNLASANELASQINQLVAVNDRAVEFRSGIVSEITQTSEKAKEAIHISGKAIVSAIAGRSKTINDVINRSVENFLEAADKSTEIMEIKLNKNVQILGNVTEKAIASCRETEKMVGNSVEIFDKTVKDHGQKIGLMSRELGKKFEASAVDFERAVSGYGQTIQLLSSELDKKVEFVVEGFAKVVTGHGTTIELLACELGKKVETSVKGFENAVTGHDKTIGLLSSGLGKKVEDSLVGFEKAVKGHGKTIDLLFADLDKKVIGMNSKIDDVNVGFEKLISNCIQEMDALALKRFGVVAKRLTDLNALIGEKIDYELRSIAARSESLNEQLSSRADKFESLIGFDDELSKRAVAGLSGLSEAFQSSVELTLASARKSEQGIMQQGARLIRLHELLNDRLTSDFSQFDARAISIEQLMEDHAAVIKQLIDHEENLTDRIIKRLDTAVNDVMKTAISAEDRLASITHALKEREEAIFHLLEMIKNESNFLPNKVSHGRIEGSARLLGYEITPKLDQAASNERRQMGWVSTLIKNASSDDPGLFDNSTRRRGNRKQPNLDVSKILENISENIDSIFDENSAYLFWCDPEAESFLLRSKVSDYGNMIFSYLENKVDYLNNSEQCNDQVKKFKNKIKLILTEKGERELLDYFVTSEGRSLTIISEASGHLPEILKNISQRLNGGLPRQKLGTG